MTAAADSLGSEAWLRTPWLSLTAKAVALPVSGLAALLSVRTIVNELGVAGYALFAVVTTLPALLPIGDLGAGAAVIDAIASSDGSGTCREHIQRTVVSGARALTWTGLFIAASSVLAVWSGAHTKILGTAAGTGAGACLITVGVLLACSLPLSLGASTLSAVGRFHVAQLLQAGGSVLGLAVILVAAALHAPAAMYCAAGPFGQCVGGATALLITGRQLRMPLLRTVALSLRPGLRTTRIIHLAGPMAVISATSALTYGTDRLVLGHVAGAVDVAVYSAGAQLYAPASSLIQAAGLSLWALFTRHRTTDDRSPKAELLRLTWRFTAAAVPIGALLVTAGPFVASWMMHGRVVVGGELMAAFATLILVHAVNYPVGMWLTDAASLHFQAVCTAVIAVLSLALSIPLAAALGPAGPVLASTAAYGSCVLAPCFRRVFRNG
ncbi:hypothetical protein AB0M41_09250 [Streptomyces sp. NPDC051896]|uniref:lipopolysaccharide biosynthesis protein n=1 Tax=Streptomyces sp. NPDC051896 TaxID=3155416 RepID=UPI003414BD8D